MKQALIVGCGLSGAVIARELAEKGYRVKVLEKRNHIGGNMYDYVDEYGILVHKYGPHTFHTKKKELFDYMCKFGEWEKYYLTCGAEIDGITTPTPFNFKTIDDFYSEDNAKELKAEISKTFPGKDYATVVETLECGNCKVSDYAQFLFDKDYSLYSAKQWGCKPSEIDPSILKRVPLRFNYDEGYFDDEFQVMPKISFTTFFENILNHENIEVELNVDALEHLKIIDGHTYVDGEKVDYPIIYSGPLDELFNCAYGKLPYRSLDFAHIIKKGTYQTNAVRNYTSINIPYTRTIEHKHFLNCKNNKTIISFEFPSDYDNSNEPYYPIGTKQNNALYSKYASLPNNKTYFLGRLGEYKYINMSDTIKNDLSIKMWVGVAPTHF